MNKALLYIAALGLIWSCKENTPVEDPAPTPEETIVTLTDAQMRNAGIQTMVPTVKNISALVKVNGKITVTPENMVSVSAPLGGYVKNIRLLPGAMVRKGDVIATLEDRQFVELQEEYLVVKSKLAFAEKEFTRQSKLNRQQASSDKVTQLAEADFNSLQISLNALAQKLELININPQKLTASGITSSVNLYSPIAGTVSKVNVNVGMYASPQDVLLELMGTNNLILQLNVFEKDAARIKVGQSLFAYSNANDKQYDCRVVLVGKAIGATGLIPVHCTFNKPDNLLMPGMYMNAEIEIEQSRKDAVPEESVVGFEGKEFVFVALGRQKYEILEVNTGEKEHGWIQILNAEDLKNRPVVSKGAYTLLMKMKNKEE